ncbi:unnamed protein product [Caretta caretta]
MGPQAPGFALALCLLAAAPPETQAEADFKDCFNISKLATEGHEVAVPLNTSVQMKVEKWNSANSTWESVLFINNGKSHLLNSKFADQFTVSQGYFIVKNASRVLQGLYSVTWSLSSGCVALINLTVQAEVAPPSVIPGNQAPAAHPVWWALLLIPIVLTVITWL